MPAVSPVEASSDVESDLASFDDLLLPVRFLHIMLDLWQLRMIVLDVSFLASDGSPQAALVRALGRAGFKRPSPVQRVAIPLGRFGSDIIVQACNKNKMLCSASGEARVLGFIATVLLQR